MVARYKSIKQDPARTQYKSNSPVERKRRKSARALMDKVGIPKQPHRGRAKGSKSTTTIRTRRMLDAIGEDKILPHEFLLLVLNKGLRGETLGMVEKDGKIVPNVVTFDQMLHAAEAGIKFFAAPLRVDVGGPGGGPLQVYHIPADRLQSLDTEELERLVALLPKLGSTIKTIEHQAGDGDDYAREIGMLPEKAA